jgi:cell shape-determining protein MreC
LDKTTKARNEAQQEIARWQATGIQPDQVVQMKADLKDASEAKMALAEEKKIFLRSIENLQNRLDRYENVAEKPIEMPGLKGSVVAVDPKWDFVILDVGENQGAKARGIVMVRRGDKLIGKAKIVSVEANRSIANLLTDWKQGDIAVAEGDKVLY